MNEKIKLILASTRYATISTVGEDGQPWAAPVWYVSDDRLNIYWWSPTESQHSKNISANPKVYITIFDSTIPEGEGLGLYIRGHASTVDENELDEIISLYNSSTEKFKMSHDNCSTDAPTRLYKLIPYEMWINSGLERDGFYIDTREKIDK